MSDKLANFLTQLSTDNDLFNAYDNDRVGTMKAQGLSDEHIDLVVNNKYSEIQDLLGANYKVSTHHIIRAYKK